MPKRYRPTRREGLSIQYKLKVSREGFASIGKRLGLTKQVVCDVVFGKRHSRRIESEISRILGKADWNEVVLEARSEVQKRPVKDIVREIEQKLDAGKKQLAKHAGEFKTAQRKAGKRRVTA